MEILNDADKEKGLLFLMHTFPLYSTTFISNEVDELRRQGVALKLFAIQPPQTSHYPKEMNRFFTETTYLFPIHFFKMLARHFRALFFMPITYLQTLWGALSWGKLAIKDRIRTCYHFVEAIYFYPEIASAGCQHLHVHFLSGGATIAFFLHKMYGVRYSLTAHGTDIFVEKVWLKEKLSHAVIVRVGTRYNQQYLKGLLPSHVHLPIHVLPFGINVDMISRTEPKLSSGRLMLLNVGNLVWQKAQGLLLEACHLLCDMGIDFHLTIVGRGPLRHTLEKKREALDLTSRVTLTGALSPSDVFERYRHSDIFVLSSVSEGFGMVLIEAMAAGVPVVAPALNGIAEIVDDGTDGRLFQPGSVQSLALVLQELCGDQDRRKQFGQNGQRKARERYQLTQAVSRFYSVLQQSTHEKTLALPVQS